MTNWYNVNWLYRKSHVITGSSGAGTNYQIKIIAHYGSGSDSGADVYLNSHSKTNFEDVRFTASDGTTLLNYWTNPSNYTISDHQEFWVQVAADLGSSQTIYIYYDNPSASTTSSGASTFPDGFLSGASPAESGDQWAATSETSGTNYVNGSQNQITVGATLGQTKAGRSNTFDCKMLNAFNLQNMYVGGCSETHFGSISGHNVEVDLDYYTQTLDAYGGYWDSFVFVAFKFADATYWMVRMATADNPQCRDDSIITTAPSSTGVTITCPANVSELGDGTGSWLSKLINALTYHASSTVTDVYVGVSGGFDNNTGHGDVEAYFQNIRVRKRIATEPVNSTWGAEEQTAYTSTFSIDTLFTKLGIVKTDKIDVVLTKLGLTKQQQIDFRSLLRFSRPYSVNVMFEKFGIIDTDKIDVMFKKLGATKPYYTDILVAARVTSTDNVDTVLKKLGVKKTDSIDIMFKKFGVTKPNSIDVILSPHATRPEQIDILLAKLGITKTDKIDVLLLSKTISLEDSIDVMFKKFGVKTTDHIDVLLKKMAIPKTSLIDAVITSLTPPTPPAEVPETLKITNGTITLWVRPISWKESQSCDPAIRPLPLAQSEYLDDGTWVLKPRQLEVKIRLSDREKNVFESLYNSVSMDGVTNEYLNFYLIHNKFVNGAFVADYTWYYQLWIREKHYTYEYALQANRYVRWWTVELTCDVQSFSGSSSTITAPDSTIYPIAMAVSLADEDLEHILDFSRDDRHPPMIPNWINEATDLVDSYIWNECVLDTGYICRMSNEEKYHIDLLLQAHKKILYCDYIHNIFSKSGIGGGEQIINGGFENIMWMTGWGIQNDYNVVSTNPHSGTYCCATDGDWYIDVGQTLANPVPVSAVKSFKMWLRSSYVSISTFEVDFITTTGTFVTTNSIIATDGNWYQYDLREIMLDNDVTGNLISFEIIVYAPEGEAAIDDVSLNANSIGAWIASVDASWDDTNWIKPWKVSIALKTNNSETESRAVGDSGGGVLINATNHAGTMYLDETTVSMPADYTGTYEDEQEGGTNSCDVGVHVLYYFQPTGSIWDGWAVTGDIIIMEERGGSTTGISGEHTLTVFIYGNCTINADWHYPAPPNDITFSSGDYEPNPCGGGTHFVELDYGLISVGGATEQIVNGGFETGDFTGWTVGNDDEFDNNPPTISTAQKHSGTYSTKFEYNSASWVKRTFGTPIPVNTVSSLGYWVYCATACLYPTTIISYSDDFSTIVGGSGDFPINTWVYVDLMPSLKAGRHITSIEISQLYWYDTWIDDVDLSTSTPLPFDEVLSLSTPYSLQYFPAKNHIAWGFVNWESSGNITIDDTNANPTSFTVDSGTTGWIRAVITNDYQVYLSSSLDNPCFPAVQITIDGTPYICPDTYYEYYGDYTTSAAASLYQGALPYVFDHWVVGGGVSVDSTTSASTTLHIHGNGSLEAVYHLVTITLNSYNMNDPCDTNKGTWNEWWNLYPAHGSPDEDWSPYSLPSTDNWLTSKTGMKYIPAGGYAFDHWETSGAVTITLDVHNNINEFTNTDSCTITAVYKPTPAAPSPSGTITRIQTNRGTLAGGGGYELDMSITAPTNGNVLIACISLGNGHYPYIDHITQTGVTWTSIGHYFAEGIPQASIYWGGAEIWIGIVGSGASGSLKIFSANSVSGSAPTIVANVLEYSNLDTANLVDQMTTHDGYNTSTQSTGTTGTTDFASELLVGCIAITHDTSSNSGSPTNGFTLVDGASFNGTISCFLEKIVGSTGTASTQVTTTYSSTLGYGAVIATFRGKHS